MRIFGLPFIIMLVWLGCKSHSPTGGHHGLQPYGCPYLVQKDPEQFGEMSSLYYTLDTLHQEGKMLHLGISSAAEINRAALYWTGDIRESYPPQASVKLILYGQPGTGRQKEYSLCYDVSIMEDAGERVNIYIMDDEASIDFYFQ